MDHTGPVDMKDPKPALGNIGPRPLSIAEQRATASMTDEQSKRRHAEGGLPRSGLSRRYAHLAYPLGPALEQGRRSTRAHAGVTMPDRLAPAREAMTPDSKSGEDHRVGYTKQHLRSSRS